MHCDHIKRAEAYPELFWEPDNLQTLCATCHNSDKQREENGGQVKARFDNSGRVQW